MHYITPTPSSAPAGATEATLATIKPAIDLVKTAVDAGTAATDASKTALLAALAPLATEATLAALAPALKGVDNKTLSDIVAALSPLAGVATNATLVEVRDNIAALATSNTAQNATLATGLDLLHTDMVDLKAKSDAVKAAVDLVKTAVDANTTAVNAVEAQVSAVKAAVDGANAAIVAALANKATTADVQATTAQVAALITSSGLDSDAEQLLLAQIKTAAEREYELGEWRGVVAITAGGDWAIGDNLSYRDAIDLTNGTIVPLTRQWFNDTTQIDMAGGLSPTDYEQSKPLAKDESVIAVSSVLGTKNQAPSSVFSLAGQSIISVLKGLFEFLYSQRRVTRTATASLLANGIYEGKQIQIYAPTVADTFSVNGVAIDPTVSAMNFNASPDFTSVELALVSGQVTIIVTN